MYDRALSLREKVLGPDHPHVALSLNDLAVLLQNQVRFRYLASVGRFTFDLERF